MHPLRRLHGHALVWLVLVPALAAGGCRPAPSSDVSDSLYVAAIGELRRVQYDTTIPVAERPGAREAVLQRRGLTVARLEQKARTLAADPVRASRIFQAVAQKNAEETARNASTRPGRATPPPSAPPSPVPPPSPAPSSGAPPPVPLPAPVPRP